ncbi:MAG: hypothetical protein AAF705_11230, partial [Bacteroidota bacterium]
MKPTAYFLIFACIFFYACQPENEIQLEPFKSDWQDQPDITRNFAGPAYWLNPLQAWQQKEGKLQVVVPGGDRNCVLLTHRLDTLQAAFSMQVDLELKTFEEEKTDASNSTTDQNATDGNPQGTIEENAWLGFQIGLQGEFQDYRDDA